MRQSLTAALAALLFFPPGASGQESPLTRERLVSMTTELQELQRKGDLQYRAVLACALYAEASALQALQGSEVRKASQATAIAFAQGTMSDSQFQDVANHYGFSIGKLEAVAHLAGRAQATCEIYTANLEGG